MNVIEALNSTAESSAKSLPQYVLIGAVIAAGVFLMTVPQNLNSTVSSEAFVTYTGIGGGGDIRIDVRQTEDISAQTESAEKLLEADMQTDKFVSLVTKNYRLTLWDGSRANLNVEQSDHLVFPVAYASGRAPTGALNGSASAEVLDELTRLNRESTTILMVTHDSKVASRCGMILYLMDGMIKGEFDSDKKDSDKKRERKAADWLAEMGW